MPTLDETAARIKEATGGKPCAECGGSSFTLFAHTLHVPTIAGGTVDPYFGFGLLALSCQQCGHVLMFNAGHYGWTGHEPPPSETTPNESPQP